MNVERALNKLSSNLELSESKRADVSRQARVLRERLVGSEHLSIAEHILSGSYARHTAIQPLNDVDLFFVLAEPRHAALRRGRPTDTLGVIQQALDAAYPNNDLPIVQSRSVRIDFSGTGVSYDVVPAFDEGNGVYRIPCRRSNDWIRTNPRVHKALSTQANERSNGFLKRTFKVIKHWRNLHDRPGRSFHLEVLSWSAPLRPEMTRVRALQVLFEHLAMHVHEPCPDPSGLGPDIDAGIDLTERETLQELLNQAATHSAQAASHAGAGRSERAHHVLRELLGADYPEKGSARVASVATTAGAAARRSTDNPRSRFG